MYDKIHYKLKKTNKQTKKKDDKGCMELSSSSCAEISVPIDLRRVSQGISGVSQRKPSQLCCMMGNGPLFRSQCRGNGHYFKLILATPNYFTFLSLHQCPSRLVRDFCGTLCSSIKQIKSPYLFVCEKALLCTQCRGIGTHLSAKGKFHGFSRVAAGTWGTFPSYGRGSH